MPSSDSMRGAAVRLCLFLLPVLACWGLLEWWLTRVPSSHSVKHAFLEAAAPAADTLILGSSGAYWDIAPPYLSGSAYNLGNVAQTLYYDDQLATRWLERMPKLRRVIIAVPYVSLFFQLQGTDEAERQYGYFQQWRIPPAGMREWFDLRMVSDVALRTPLFAVSSLKTAVIQYMHGAPLAGPPVDPPIRADGWSPRWPPEPSELADSVVKTKIAYHHGLMHWSDEAPNRAALEHLVGLLHGRGIEVIIVTPPVWPAYAALIRKDYWARAQADFRELEARYGVRYFNYMRDPGFTADDFLDADHLNEHGAVHFTKLLSAAIDGPTERHAGPTQTSPPAETSTTDASPPR